MVVETNIFELLFTNHVEEQKIHGEKRFSYTNKIIC